MRSLVTLLAIAFAVLLLLGGAVWALQRSMLFPGPAGPPREPARIDPAIERLWLDTTEGRVESWLLPPLASRDGKAPLLLFAHGNGERIDDWVEAFEVARRWGLAVLLVEYPGYGRSEGTPREASLAETMRAAWDTATARPDVDAERVVGWGRSLGGGAVGLLSRERPLCAVVLESSFTSVRALARGMHVPGFLVRDPFDTAEALAAYPGPVLVVHGRDDALVPVVHGRALAGAARGPSELVVLDCGHNDCPRPWDALRRFLERNGVL